jgi:hypothetical protein
MPNRRELGYVSAGSVSTIPGITGYGVATGGSSSSRPITVSVRITRCCRLRVTGNLVVTSAGLFDVLMFGGGAGGSSGQIQSQAVAFQAVIHLQKIRLHQAVVVAAAVSHILAQFIETENHH